MDKGTEFNFGCNEDTPTRAEPGEQPQLSAGSGCFGLLVCPHCGQSVMCSDVQYKKGEDMINRSQQSGGQSQNKQRSGLPFLTTAVCTMSPQPGQIISARVEPNPYKRGEEQVSLRIEFRGAHYLFALRDGNPSLDNLCNSFSSDENSWIGKKLSIYNEEDRHNGKLWVRLEAAPEPTTETTQRKRG